MFGTAAHSTTTATTGEYYQCLCIVLFGRARLLRFNGTPTSCWKARKTIRSDVLETKTRSARKPAVWQRQRRRRRFVYARDGHECAAVAVDISRRGFRNEYGGGSRRVTGANDRPAQAARWRVRPERPQCCMPMPPPPPPLIPAFFSRIVAASPRCNVHVFAPIDDCSLPIGLTGI